MTPEQEQQRRQHARAFLVSDVRNDDLVECLVNYRDIVVKEELKLIMAQLSAVNPGMTWTNGLESAQILHELCTLLAVNENASRMIYELEGRINELETRIQIIKGE